MKKCHNHVFAWLKFVLFNKWSSGICQQSVGPKPAFLTFEHYVLMQIQILCPLKVLLVKFARTKMWQRHKTEQNHPKQHKIFKNDTFLTHLHEFDIHNIHIQCLIMRKDPPLYEFLEVLIPVLYLVMRVSTFGLVSETWFTNCISQYFSQKVISWHSKCLTIPKGVKMMFNIHCFTVG